MLPAPTGRGGGGWRAKKKVLQKGWGEVLGGGAGAQGDPPTPCSSPQKSKGVKSPKSQSKSSLMPSPSSSPK